LKTAEDSNQSLLGPPAVAAVRQLLSIPVAVSASVDDGTIVVLDKRAVLSAYGPLRVATSEYAALHRDSLVTRITWRNASPVYLLGTSREVYFPHPQGFPLGVPLPFEHVRDGLAPRLPPLLDLIADRLLLSLPLVGEVGAPLLELVEHVRGRCLLSFPHLLDLIGDRLLVSHQLVCDSVLHGHHPLLALLQQLLDALSEPLARLFRHSVLLPPS
jgi:hypothetical protein